MHVVFAPASQDAVIKFKNYNSPIYTGVLSRRPLRGRMQLSNSRIITLQYTQACCHCAHFGAGCSYQIREFQLSNIHMHVVTAPASQDAVIKLKNYNSPIYTCMLSLCPLRRMQ